METLIKVIEIFALVTGVAYVTLEVFQKNLMWVFGIATGLACAFSFGVQHLYATMALSIYYVGVSVVGIHEWRKASKQLVKEAPESSIHLNRLTLRTAVISAVVFVLGTILLVIILRLIDDPSSNLDAMVTVASAIATWWLAKSYLPQWIVWIAADTLTTTLCLMHGMYWMGAMYAYYIIVAFYGFFHWKKKGIYIG